MNCNVTYEELAALSAGDLEDERQSEIRRHLQECNACRQRLGALDKADAALRALRPVRPPAWVILNTRRALADATDGRQEPGTASHSR